MSEFMNIFEVLCGSGPDTGITRACFPGRKESIYAFPVFRYKPARNAQNLLHTNHFLVHGHA